MLGRELRAADGWRIPVAHAGGQSPLEDELQARRSTIQPAPEALLNGLAIRRAEGLHRVDERAARRVVYRVPVGCGCGRSVPGSDDELPGVGVRHRLMCPILATLPGGPGDPLDNPPHPRQNSSSQAIAGVPLSRVARPIQEPFDPTPADHRWVANKRGFHITCGLLATARRPADGANMRAEGQRAVGKGSSTETVRRAAVWTVAASRG